MISLGRPSSGRRMILARITSQYGDVYFLARDSSACRSSLERSIVNGLFLGIRDAVPLMQEYHNTSLYLRMDVLSYGTGHAAVCQTAGPLLPGGVRVLRGAGLRPPRFAGHSACRQFPRGSARQLRLRSLVADPFHLLAQRL